MRDFSNNKYVTSKLAVERAVSEQEVRTAVGCVVAMHGFSVHLIGTRRLISLLYDYIYVDGFDLHKAVRAFADDDKVDLAYAFGCILASIRYNNRFNAKASALLEQPIKLKMPDIIEVLDIMSASYKIYYNYILDTDEIIDDTVGADNE